MAKADDLAAQPIEVVETLQVLGAEHARIWPDKSVPASLPDYYRSVQASDQAALCLSGGGIRSAAFALGVLQALSRKRLLTQFHYLSTVSGGGYIGGWLQRWMREDGAANVADALRRSCAEVKGKGAAARDEDSPTLVQRSVKPRQIRALRENSNFITPRVGLGSNDTWTAISISVRNIAINWLLFTPLFLLVAIVPNLFASLVGWAGAAGSDGLLFLALGVSVLCATIAAWRTCRALPSDRASIPDAKNAGDGWLARRIVVWLVVWALAGTVVLWIDVNGGEPLGAVADAAVVKFGRALPTDLEHSAFWHLSGLGFAGISFVATVLALFAAGLTLPGPAGDKGRDYRGAFRGDMMLWAGAVFVGAVSIPVGCILFETVAPLIPQAMCPPVFAAVMPLWLMESQLLVAFVFAAFRRDRGGTVQADEDREWLARLSAVKIRQMMLWGVLAFATMILIELLDASRSAGTFSLTGLFAALTGGTAVLGGRGSRSGNATTSTPVKILRILPLRTVVMLATFAFILLLFALFGAIENWIAGGLEGLFVGTKFKLLAGLWNDRVAWTLPFPWFNSRVVSHLLIGLVCVVLLWWLDKRIPVNRFSLNGLYRNRISRAFLGGARETRKPDPFTGFDPDDNVEVHKLDPKIEEPAKTGEPEKPPRTVLYPVINVALNVTATKNLAWQERKAAPFIVSPLYCGSGMLVKEGDDQEQWPRSGAYVSANLYGGSEFEQAKRRWRRRMAEPEPSPRGISLATAVAISGAAASPNMGYHSSPATAFLMTLFNVRLGAWLPNPARAPTLGNKVYRSNPPSSLRAILRELGGATDDQGLDIYLSDGGHFENLAVYEMIRRRCRFIVVSDAGADPNCDFTDLGNLVRKAKIDLGADVAFTKMRISSRTKPIEPQFAWALGKICYGDGQSGRILYIKPSFFGRDLPLDVVSYAAASASFPHESTGDQFFSESQFESYRKLGFTLAREIGDDLEFDSIPAFFAALDGNAHEEDESDRKLRARFVGWLRGLGG